MRIGHGYDVHKLVEGAVLPNATKLPEWQKPMT